MLWSVPKKMFFLTPVLLGHMARLLQNASDSSLELKTGFFSRLFWNLPTDVDLHSVLPLKNIIRNTLQVGHISLPTFLQCLYFKATQQGNKATWSTHPMNQNRNLAKKTLVGHAAELATWKKWWQPTLQNMILLHFRAKKARLVSVGQNRV